MTQLIKTAARKIVPRQMRPWLRRKLTGSANFGNLRRLVPISSDFGFDRGQPVDRYYIDKFLSLNAEDIRGRIMEFGDDRYIRMFGASRVTRADVLHVVPGNPAATIVADITRADDIPTDSFDCIIMTQTLQMIYDMRSGIGHLHRILKPGGVLLLTTHGISRVCRREGQDDWGEYWHLTSQGAARLFAESFPAQNIKVTAYGNVLSAIASLHGLAAEELSAGELDHRDWRYEVLVAVRAEKAAATA
ncbi:MAG TPA: methyltransferase domain-containing protein [Tepidisphaeraceae bacterium]|jgi:SAM-dependent methyltransferase|nr:methyltransferase domain-containing protein [Tepidisphaeraceae bacterium]